MTTNGSSGRDARIPLRIDPSTSPPGGLKPEEVPVFVVFGNDDNGYSGLDENGKPLAGAGGTGWMLEMFNGKNNPVGRGNPATYDGAPVHFTLLGLSRYLATDGDPLCKRAWRMAFDAGHEIGNHTATHPRGSEATVAEWGEEIASCQAQIQKPWEPQKEASDETGVGVPEAEIVGFRSPYLQYNDNLFPALEMNGFRYDCSIEEGYEAGQDGTNHYWPYTLHGGSPANASIGSYPSLLEIPVYPFVVPADGDCAAYGVSSGLRESLLARESGPQFVKDHAHDTVHVEDGRIRGMDYDLWKEYEVTKEEFVAILKHTLDVHLAGNRAPMTVCMHSDFYCPNPWGDSSFGVETAIGRQEALQAFFDYAASKEDVRIVSGKELLAWLENPTPL